MRLANDGEIQGEHWPDPDEEAAKEAAKAIPEVPNWDPTEYIPVMRHHLHKALLAVGNAYGKSAAEDLANAYRDGKPTWATSRLSGQLAAATQQLEEYLGLLDEEVDDDRETVSENE